MCSIRVYYLYSLMLYFNEPFIGVDMRTTIDAIQLANLKDSIPLNLQVGNCYFHWTPANSWEFVPSSN